MKFWKIGADHVPYTVETVDEWVDWFTDAREDFEELCRVAKTHIDGDCYVSTVFLFAYSGDAPLFETMVFGGGAHDLRQRRYGTWEEAAAGHAAMVDAVMARTAL